MKREKCKEDLHLKWRGWTKEPNALYYNALRGLSRTVQILDSDQVSVSGPLAPIPAA